MSEEKDGIIMPEGADDLFPLKFDSKSKDHVWKPEDFEYVHLRAFGERADRNHNGGFYVDWGVKGWGFGSFEIWRTGGVRDEMGELTGGKIMLDSEAMSKEFVKAALAKLVDIAEMR